MTLRNLIERLQRFDIEAPVREALAVQAELMASSVRAALGGEPGAAHDSPWQRSGALHASIGSDADARGAVVGSTDPVALYQELGTAAVPPRPFLAPVAAAGGAAAAEAVGRAVVQAIEGA